MSNGSDSYAKGIQDLLTVSFKLEMHQHIQKFVPTFVIFLLYLPADYDKPVPLSRRVRQGSAAKNIV